MDFQNSFTKQVQNLCTKLVVTDTSNYGFNDNNQHLEISDFTIRRVTVFDSLFQTELAQYTFVGDEKIATFDITNWLTTIFISVNINLELIGSGFSYSNNQTFLLPCVLP